MCSWDAPDFNLEPPENAEAMAWCDCCLEWRTEHCEAGWGWCATEGDFMQPAYDVECPNFSGDQPSPDDIYGDDPRIDMAREELVPV